MFSKKLTPEEKYYKNMEQMQKKLNHIEKQNSRSRQGYKHQNNAPKSGGSFLGFIAAALFMAAGFYIFTITVPKIGGEEFEVDKVTSIVDVVQTGKLPEKQAQTNNQDEGDSDQVSEDENIDSKIKKLSAGSLGAEDALKGGSEVMDKGKVAASGFMSKFTAMFSKKPKEEADKTRGVTKPGENKLKNQKQTEREQRVVLDEKLKEKNKKNEKGEIVNDLSYYEK